MAGEKKPERHLLLTFQNREGFLEAYEQQGTVGNLMVVGREGLAPGQLVDMEIAFADDLMVFHARGLVRYTSGNNAKIALLPTEEATRRVLLEYVDGRNLHALRRRPRRFPIHIAVNYTTDSEFIEVTTGDLSNDGAFLITDTLPAAGTLIALRLSPPSSDPITINAEVAWQRKKEPRGVGVRFLIGDPVKQRIVRKLVDALLRQHTEDGTIEE